MNERKYRPNVSSVRRAVDLQQEAQGIKNRANDTKFTNGDGSTSVNFYTVDNAIMQFLSENINPIVTQDGVAVKIPVVYGNSERWKGVQKDGIIRDRFNKIQLPIMMVRRTGIKRGKASSPVNKYLVRSFDVGWNKYTPYDKFSVLNNIKPSRERYNVVTPDYYDFSYDLYIWTEYVEQMNSVVEDVSFELDEYWGIQNGFKFRVTADEFEMTVETPPSGERMVRTKTSLTAYAYLLPAKMLDKNNMISPVTKITHTPKKIVTFTETVDNFE